MMLYYQGREVSWLACLAYPTATVAYPGSAGYTTHRVRYRWKVSHTPSTDYSVNGDEAVVLRLLQWHQALHTRDGWLPNVCWVMQF